MLAELDVWEGSGWVLSWLFGRAPPWDGCMLLCRHNRWSTSVGVLQGCADGHSIGMQRLSVFLSGCSCVSCRQLHACVCLAWQLRLVEVCACLLACMLLLCLSLACTTRVRLGVPCWAPHGVTHCLVGLEARLACAEWVS
jgi:hypothetical protein